MSALKIENLKEIVKETISGDVIGHEAARLTAPGENYFSLVLKVDIKVKTENDQEKIVNAVAKLNTPTHPKDMIQNIFRREIDWYTKVVPNIQSVLKGNGDDYVDLFPKYLGSSLEKGDSSPVMILENLIPAGYKNLDRCQGFDLQTAKFVLNDLALFHAVPMAIRLQNPDTFEKNIKPYLGMLQHPPPPPPDAEKHNPILRIKKIIEENEACIPLIPKVEKLEFMKWSDEVREPWVTIVHRDFWVNNIMLKFEEERLSSTKIVDFQMCDVKSPAKDVVFFLLSSTNTNDLRENLDELIKYYYEKLIAHLNRLRVNTKLFTYEGYLKELEIEAKNHELIHSLVMMFVIFTEKGTVPEDCDPRWVVESDREVTITQKERMWLVTQEAAKRNWI